MNCKNCGSPIAADDMFCGTCGAKIEPASFNPPVQSPTSADFFDPYGTYDVKDGGISTPPIDPNDATQPFNIGSQGNPVPPPIFAPGDVPAQGFTPQEPVTQGFVPQGSIPQGPMPQGPMPQGPMPVKPPMPPEKKKMIIIISIAAAVVVIAVVALIFIFGGDKDDTETTVPQSTTASQGENVSKNYSDDSYDDEYDDEYDDYSSDDDQYLEDTFSAIYDELEDTPSDMNAAFEIINLSTGEKRNYCGNTSQTASALVVYPVLYAYAQSITSGDMSDSTLVPVSHYSAGRGVLKKSDVGKNYTVENLFKLAFNYSDNTAINSLIDYMGMSRIESICAADGFSSVTVEKYVGIDSDGNNQIGAEDAALMIYELWHNNYPMASDILSSCGITDRDNLMGMCDELGSYETSFNGYTGKVFNEVTIFEVDGTMYCAVFLTDGDSTKAAVNVARGLGMVLYQYA